MALRNETTQRKMAMLRDLREAHLQGNGVRNEGALSQRELSSRYELSGQTVSALLKQLVEEGVLYTVPRVGTFLGRPPLETLAPYIFVSHVPREFNTFVDQMQMGFYDRVAKLGASGITLTIEEMEWHLKQGNLNSISGAFFYQVPSHMVKELLERSGTNAVSYGTANVELQDFAIDTVDFDDEKGGVEATQHLLLRGHRNIAFLGLHITEREDESFYWSVQRKAGWQRMMQSAGQEAEDLVFLPTELKSHHVNDQIEAASKTASELIRVSQITAVVAANMYAAQGLLKTLQATVPAPNWPSIVCFDDVPLGGTTGVSYMRLPWEKVGAEAAQLLWERQTGRTKGAPQKRQVNMHLIPRLTCQRDWALSGLAHAQVMHSAQTVKEVSELLSV